jgi:hypothetical protein
MRKLLALTAAAALSISIPAYADASFASRSHTHRARIHLAFSIPSARVKQQPASIPTPVPATAAYVPVQDIYVYNAARVAGTDLYAIEQAIQWQALTMRQHWGNPAIQFFNLIGSPSTAVADGDYLVSLLPSQPVNGGSFHNVIVGPYASIPVVAGQTTDWQMDMSHETIEMLMDPYLSSWYFGHQLLEICDPVADAAYFQSGVMVADFVFPSWFSAGSRGPWDEAGALTYAGELDGYPPTS